MRPYHKTAAHQQYRQRSGRIVPGASTIAKLGEDPEGLIAWAWDLGQQGLDYRKVRDAAADTGNLVHFMAECWFLKEEPDLSAFSAQTIAEAAKPFAFFTEWVQKNQLVFDYDSADPELQLVSETYPFGGTLDLPLRDWEGRRVLLDWKTSKQVYPQHLQQLAAYEWLWNEHNPQSPIMRRAIIRLGRDGSFEACWAGDLVRQLEVFLAKLNLWQIKQKYNML